MLIRRAELAAIERGDVRVAFRRWDRPRVLPGTRLRTAVGVLRVEAVDEVDPDALTDADAHAAGLASVAELRAFLDRKVGRVWRVRLAFAGPDPRMALRERTHLAGEELADLARRLEGWPRDYLELIGRAPGVRASFLAEGLGMETQAFKRRVRQLKELGLTISLRPGYRLSPRGEVVLHVLRTRDSRGG